jgi:hypothetical protein
MLILPPGHWQAVAARQRLRTRDKWIIASVLGLVAAGVVALVISFASSGRTSGNGCVDVTSQYVTGGTELYRCGPGARSLCNSVGVGGGYGAALSLAIARECRKAGLPVSG